MQGLRLAARAALRLEPSCANGWGCATPGLTSSSAFTFSGSSIDRAAGFASTSAPAQPSPEEERVRRGTGPPPPCSVPRLSSVLTP